MSSDLTLVKCGNLLIATVAEGLDAPDIFSVTEKLFRRRRRKGLRKIRSQKRPYAVIIGEQITVSSQGCSARKRRQMLCAVHQRGICCCCRCRRPTGSCSHKVHGVSCVCNGQYSRRSYTPQAHTHIQRDATVTLPPHQLTPQLSNPRAYHTGSVQGHRRKG